VSPWADEPASQIADAVVARSRPRPGIVVAIMGVALVALLGIAWLRGDRAPGAKSVAVMPFLDLTTQEMKEEYFADGLTEELINRLSKLPGFAVPSAPASFHYKNTDSSPRQIADELHVRYLLDGSLRESDDLLRISARLVRADDGFVIWTESYDRPKSDRVKTQDEIATEVARLISMSIDAG
jgi:TolB-like protein